MPKQITQEELQQVLKKDEATNRKMLNIRRRLIRGAHIEPGKLSATADSTPPNFSPRCTGIYGMGLDIGPTVDTPVNRSPPTVTPGGKPA